MGDQTVTWRHRLGARLMSGICGIIFFEGSPEILAADLEAMNDRLRHRGLDDSGVWLKNGIALGHRRLAIIDSEGGKQPLVDPRGYAITCNGEIYNFPSIRRELESRGEVFATASDTEVLLKAYIIWGEACLAKLNGMFAFAVADFTNRSLFVACDRLGIKPLYYSRFPGGFAFASEIKSLLSCRSVPRDLDLSYIPFFMRHGSFPRHHTVYRQIQRLQPGQALRVTEKALTPICYWDIQEKYPEEGAHRVTRQDEEELRALIQDAVELRTVSDVPIGAFLSGGLDTGIITSKAAAFLPYQLQTFTVGYSGMGDFEETRLAAQVAQRYRTAHHELDVTAEDLLAHYELVLAQFGQPFADPSALPTYLICRFARSRVKVMLSGDGGDMLFGGSRSYRRYLQLTRFRAFLPWASWQDVAKHLLQWSGNLAAPFRPLLAERLRRYGGLLKVPPELLFRDLSQVKSSAAVAALAGERLQPYLNSKLIHPFVRRDHRLHLDGVMLHDLKNFLVNDVLTKVETMSMAVGLEVRTPFLDHRLVEKAVTLSWQDKVSARQTKMLLRRLFAGELPPEVIAARKRGFSVPLDRWFRGQLRDLAWQVLMGPSCRKRGILNPTGVQALLEDQEAGRAYHGYQIWALLALEKWFLEVEGP
jgi:asparagine synthase (glutamine-hydrolysing)